MYGITRSYGWGIAGTLIFLLFHPCHLAGQGGESLRMTVDPDRGTVRVEFHDVFTDSGILRSLDAGLPVRVQLVTELWRDRWFDSQESRHEWRATVRADPLGGGYTVETASRVSLGVETPAQAAAVLMRELQIPLAPASSGRYYYLSRLELETLSLSDLEELRRWLRGEMAPAIGSEGDVGGALGRGVLRLFVRALNLPAQRLEARSPRFTWEGN